MRNCPSLSLGAMRLGLLLTPLAVSLAAQIPLPWLQKSLASPLQSGFEPSRLHYSKVDPDAHPVDLNQYEKQMVVRLPKAALPTLKKLGYKIWAVNVAAGTVDVQVPWDFLLDLSMLTNLAPASIVIGDLAQAVFESYPESLQRGNVQELTTSSVDEMRAAVDPSKSAVENLKAFSEVFFRLYRTLLSISAWLQLLAETYPNVITIEDLGKTHDGNDYQVLHFLVVDDDISHDDKRTVVITGGVHAREWIAVSSALYTVYEMLCHYESNPEDWHELAKLDFLFIPVANPDGYDYSWTTDRLWRKNRQTVDQDSACVGIDIDHSYDFHWLESSDSMCGEEYAGTRPFQALELQLWDSYLNETNAGHKIWGYIDLHSYLQEILYPYAFSCQQQPRDEENLIELAYGISKAIRLTTGSHYLVFPACIDRDSDLIPSMGAGSALDYMYHHKSYWAYQIKLRDSGSHGFLLPEKYIEPVGREIAAGIKAFCKFVLSDD